MISSGVQMALGLVLIGLALALVRQIYRTFRPSVAALRRPRPNRATASSDRLSFGFQPLDTTYLLEQSATAGTTLPPEPFREPRQEPLFGRAHVVPEGKRLHDVGGLAGDVCFDFRDDDGEVDLVVTVIAELQ